MFQISQLLITENRPEKEKSTKTSKRKIAASRVSAEMSIFKICFLVWVACSIRIYKYNVILLLGICQRLKSQIPTQIRPKHAAKMNVLSTNPPSHKTRIVVAVW